ncbi:MAG: DUF1786 domain-containing protein [Betaproteobacteria bacterium]
MMNSGWGRRSELDLSLRSTALPKRNDLQPLLAMDVGTGTQDILLYDPGRPLENCVKLVLPAPTVLIAREIAQATAAGKDVFLTGRIMGGGPSVGAMRRHLQAGRRLTATPEAARTIRDNLDEVRAMGVGVVSEEAETASAGSRSTEEVVELRLTDVMRDQLGQALGVFGVALPERWAVAVQDHGECLSGSNRRFRFALWEDFLARGGDLLDLLYEEAPAVYTRMRAVQAEIPGALVMDTGAAAVWGALCDEAAAARLDEGLTILNVGNGHTVGVVVQGRRVTGLFEHHTGRLTPASLANLVARLQSGRITNDEVFEDGGHGAALAEEFTPPGAFVAVTGPQRALAAGLGWHLAVPGGDMMLSGCFGLVAAYTLRRGVPGPFPFLTRWFV